MRRITDLFSFSKIYDHLFRWLIHFNAFIFAFNIKYFYVQYSPTLLYCIHITPSSRHSPPKASIHHNKKDRIKTYLKVRHAGNTPEVCCWRRHNNLLLRLNSFYQNEQWCVEKGCSDLSNLKKFRLFAKQSEKIQIVLETL